VSTLSRFKSAVWRTAHNLRLRRSLPDSSISLAATIDRESLLRPGVSIDSGALIVGSTLGEEVGVRRDCTIARSALEPHIVVNPDCTISQSTLGAYSYVAPHCTIADTTLGRFCSIGPDLLCGLGDHPSDLVTTSPVFYSTAGQCGISFVDTSRFEESTPIRIGNDVWIGARVFIRSGVTIGDGAIVGAGAVVVADVPPYAVVAGVPAKTVRMRFDAPTVDRLLAMRWWDWEEATLRAAAPLLVERDPSALFTWAAGRSS